MNDLTDIATRLRSANPIRVDAFDSARVGPLVDRVLAVSTRHDLNPMADGGATEPICGRRHRRTGVRSRVPARLAVSLALGVALVVAVSVVTLSHGSNNPHTGKTTPTQEFASPTQTSSATWNLTGLVAASGWHPQSVGATSPVQLICPTERTCIGSGVDLGVDQNSLPQQQNDIEVSNDGGASWQVAAVPRDGEYFNGFTCPSSTTCMTVGVQLNDGSGPPPPSLYVTTDGGATWAVRVMPGVVWATAALACWTTTSCIVVEQTKGFAAYVTNDAGQTWTSSQLPAGFIGPPDSDSLQCSSDGRCVAMGIGFLAYSADPAFAYSTDGGRVWQLGEAPPVHAGAGSVLSCSDALHCMAVENAGLQNGLTEVRGVVTTSDGGRTWTATSAQGLSPNSAPKYLRIGALVCVSATTCLASGQSGGSATFDSNAVTQGLVAATSDGGQSWHFESLPTIDHHAIQETTSITCPGDSQVCFVGAFTRGLDSSIVLEGHIQAVESQ
jgi:photosystem II stability/assembly factor-like uncharacterized protein